MTTPKLRCPYCGEFLSSVIDSRPSGPAIWRRRLCENPSCGKKFTTRETIVPLKKSAHPNIS
jgi:transcriptional repressor NrdR